MRIDLSFVELHTPLFFNGTNLGTKLYGLGHKSKNKNNAQLDIWYETELEHTIIVWGEHVTLVESTANKDVKDPEQLKKYITLKNPTSILHRNADAEVSVAAIPNRVVAQVCGPGQGVLKSAQVETPHSKVQDTTKRKAKYQGETVE